MVHRAIPADDPVVYMVEDLAFPVCRRRSVVVQHGIWWDGEYSWLKTRAAEAITRHAVRRSAATICVDTNFINWFRARWPRAGADDKLHYVPNFIDPAQWGEQPQDPAAVSEPLEICFPRRSVPRRGLWLMADAAPRLAARHPGLRFRFAVGSGQQTEALRARLAASMPEASWRIDELPFERMREAYEKSAIVAVPTLCGEGTSLAAIEAMFFGCAVVGTWVGGLPNLIRDRHNGLLVRPTARDLEQALDALVRDRALRVRLGTQAMAEALPSYGIGRWRAQLRPVLEKALGVGVA